MEDGLPVGAVGDRVWSMQQHRNDSSCSSERREPPVFLRAGDQAILLISSQSSRGDAGDTRPCIDEADSSSCMDCVFASKSSLSLLPFEPHDRWSEDIPSGCGPEEIRGPSCKRWDVSSNFRGLPFAHTHTCKALTLTSDRSIVEAILECGALTRRSWKDYLDA